jgi:acyl-CoA thioesterase
MSSSADELARRAAEAMWSGDHATQGLGMELVNVAQGFAEITMPVRQEMVNGHGICHGGFIFTLADSAFAFACNSRNQMTVAAGARIDFIKSAKEGDVLTARARVVHQGNRTGVYDAQVVNQAQEVIAEFRGNSATIGGQLVDESAS